LILIFYVLILTQAEHFYKFVLNSDQLD